ncbi:MAG TPA: alanine racemase [Terrimicrobiaceae bacterium]|nr:alanine racemase [Terrimicrobiaceae bacterium]
MNVPGDVRCWAEVDLSAIRHNAQVVRDKIGAGPAILAVVKANAYGHGAPQVAAALSGSVDAFGVANVEEANQLADLKQDILLLGPSVPGERSEAIARGYVATVSSAAEAANFAGGRINFKVDTGMGRIGCPEADAVGELTAIQRMGSVEIYSISTHLPVPDEDAKYTFAQLDRFAKLANTLRPIAPKVRIHALNSAGILGYPAHAHDLVRPGLMLYGSAYPEEFQPLLRPALTWKTRVLLVRDVGPHQSVSYGRTFITPHAMRIATLAIGYADGFPRQTSGRGAHVLVGGLRCPVLGRVTMDQILADVTALARVAVGDEAVLIGEQGGERILAKELADKAGTISWDIFTGIGNRTRRFYF